MLAFSSNSYAQAHAKKVSLDNFGSQDTGAGRLLADSTYYAAYLERQLRAVKASRRVVEGFDARVEENAEQLDDCKEEVEELCSRLEVGRQRCGKQEHVQKEVTLALGRRLDTLEEAVVQLQETTPGFKQAADVLQKHLQHSCVLLSDAECGLRSLERRVCAGMQQAFAMARSEVALLQEAVSRETGLAHSCGDGALAAAEPRLAQAAASGAGAAAGVAGGAQRIALEQQLLALKNLLAELSAGAGAHAEQERLQRSAEAIRRMLAPMHEELAELQRDRKHMAALLSGLRRCLLPDAEHVAGSAGCGRPAASAGAGSAAPLDAGPPGRQMTAASSPAQQLLHQLPQRVAELQRTLAAAAANTTTNVGAHAEARRSCRTQACAAPIVQHSQQLPSVSSATSCLQNSCEPSHSSGGSSSTSSEGLALGDSRSSCRARQPASAQRASGRRAAAAAASTAAVRRWQRSASANRPFRPAGPGCDAAAFSFPQPSRSPRPAAVSRSPAPGTGPAAAARGPTLRQPIQQAPRQQEPKRRHARHRTSSGSPAQLRPTPRATSSAHAAAPQSGPQPVPDARPPQCSAAHAPARRSADEAHRQPCAGAGSGGGGQPEAAGLFCELALPPSAGGAAGISTPCAAAGDDISRSGQSESGVPCSGTDSGSDDERSPSLRNLLQQDRSPWDAALDAELAESAPSLRASSPPASHRLRGPDSARSTPATPLGSLQQDASHQKRHHQLQQLYRELALSASP